MKQHSYQCVMDIIKGSKAGKSDEPIEVLDICGTASSGMSWLQNFFRDLSRQPVTKQVLIGGASGWIVGYISMKVGKAAATLLGGSLIVMQLAAHKGYIKVDWSRVNKDLERSAKKIKSEVKKNVGTNLTNDALQFAKENVVLATSFGGGVLLGIASS